MIVSRLRALLPSPAAHQEAWPRWKRIGFRFVFIYLALYCFPFPLDIVPGAVAVADVCRDFLHRVAVRLAEPLVHVPFAVNNGSGDSTSNYIRVLFFGVMAVVGTLVWSLVDRRRPSYVALWSALHLYVRYLLAAVMFDYGFQKMFGLQFPAPSPGRLAQAFGEASPMGLLWAFIGASPVYQFVAGAFEVVGGALLLFRRTTTLGALVLIGVMGNVVLLNFCYDVPVKLYSTHLWLMAVLLALPDAGRLANMLVLQRPTAPAFRLDRRDPKTRSLHRALKAAVIVALLYAGIAPAWGFYNDVPAKTGSLDGVWEVTSTEVLGPLLSSPIAWRRIAVSRYSVSIVRIDGTTVRYRLVSQDDKTLTLSRREGETKIETTLFFELQGKNEATLVGGLEGSAVDARLRRIDTSKSLLTTRGFHWINEEPFNR